MTISEGEEDRPWEGALWGCDLLGISCSLNVPGMSSPKKSQEALKFKSDFIQMKTRCLAFKREKNSDQA